MELETIKTKIATLESKVKIINLKHNTNHIPS
jgi:hypothetical protein